MKKWLYLYIIEGIPCIAISVRPMDALHVQRRTYHKITGSTVIRFLSTDRYIHAYTDGTGNQIVIMLIELEGGE